MRNQKITGPQVALRPTGPPEGPHHDRSFVYSIAAAAAAAASVIMLSQRGHYALCCAVLKRSASRLSEHVCVLLFQATGFYSFLHTRVRTHSSLTRGVSQAVPQSTDSATEHSKAYGCATL